MIKIIKIAIALGLVFLLVETFGAAAQEARTCPGGSYNIGETKVEGEIICRLEPTGCPHGDSIPLDSPKCAPTPAVVPIVDIKPQVLADDYIPEGYADIIGK